MKLDEALKTLEAVAAQFRGTIQEHHIIQQALQVVKDNVQKHSGNLDSNQSPN